MKQKKVLLDVNHAAHVHFIKNLYHALTKKGIECSVVATNKPLVYDLLDEFEIPYFKIGSYGTTFLQKGIMLVLLNFRMLFFCIRFKPQLILGIVSIRGSHIGWLLGIKSLVFTDTEHSKFQIALFKPFATKIFTPSWFSKELGPKQTRYSGFHELAFLHPDHFKPKLSNLKSLNIKPNQFVSFIRFISWDATHDYNQKGLTISQKRSLVQLLLTRGSVLISSEYPLEDEFKKFEFNLDKSLVHDCLSFCTLCISEGASTACEAAILGTPTIFMNSLELGYITHLQNEYDLIYHVKTFDKALHLCDQLLGTEDLKKVWKLKFNKFISTQMNTSNFLEELVESNLG